MSTGLDIVRQAAEECALELDEEKAVAVDEATMQALLAPLPDYEVMEEGDAWGPGEYPQGIPPSPPRLTQPAVGHPCPIHNSSLEFRVSEKTSWPYFVCVEDGCPIWVGEDDCQPVLTAWRDQVCPEVARGPFVCECNKPYKLVLCKSSQRGNQGRLFVTCRQKRCDFFQWVDTPKDQYPMQPRYPGQPRRRQLLSQQYAKPVRPRYVPRTRDSALTIWNKVRGEKRRAEYLPQPSKKPREAYHPFARHQAAPPPRLTCDCYPGMHDPDEPTPAQRVAASKKRVREEAAAEKRMREEEAAEKELKERLAYFEEEMYLAGLTEEQKEVERRMRFAGVTPEDLHRGALTHVGDKPPLPKKKDLGDHPIL